MTIGTWISKNTNLFAGLVLLAVIGTIALIKWLVDMNAQKGERNINPAPDDSANRAGSLLMYPRMSYASVLSNGNMGNGSMGMGNVGNTGAGFNGGRVNQGGSQAR